MKPAIKIYAFIDSQNLNLGVQSQGWKLDFRKFRKYLLEKYNVEKAFLFIGFIAKYRPLYEYLASAGYTLIFKPTIEQNEKGETTIKGNVDAELVLHSMIEYQNYDQALLVSGDGDFHCLIEYFEKQKKLKKIIVPNQKYSSLLRKFSHFIVNIGLWKEKLEQ